MRHSLLSIQTVTSNTGLTKLLVWNDASGGLVQYRDLSSLGFGNVSACGSAATNYFTKWTSTSPDKICNSLVYDNGSNVGIGTTTPACTLDVNGTIAAKQILIEDKNETKDLLALITELQNEVAELKQQLCTLAKN